MAKETARHEMRVSDRVKTTFYALAIAVGSVLVMRLLTAMASTTVSNLVEFVGVGFFFLLVMAGYKKMSGIKIVW